jgi:hypothetical protein
MDGWTAAKSPEARNFPAENRELEKVAGVVSPEKFRASLFAAGGRYAPMVAKAGGVSGREAPPTV